MERLTQTSNSGGVAFTFDLDITCQASEAKKILKLAEKLKRYEDAEEQGIYGKWIPVSERLPETDKYIMLSFDNFTLPDIGRYEVNENGDGAFYPGDDEKSSVEYGLFVNAWMPLPEPYRESEV